VPLVHHKCGSILYKKRSWWSDKQRDHKTDAQQFIKQCYSRKCEVDKKQFPRHFPEFRSIPWHFPDSC